MFLGSWSCTRDHPNSQKNAPRMEGQMKILMWVSINSGNRSGSCSENCGFSYCSSRGMPFREWNFEFRELLRECPGTLPELREWPFRSESVFPEIGVVPRLLTWAFWASGTFSHSQRTKSGQNPAFPGKIRHFQAFSGACFCMICHDFT